MTSHEFPRYLAEVSPEVADTLAESEGVERVTHRQVLCSAVGLLNLKKRGTLFFANGGAVLVRPGQKMITFSELRRDDLPKRYL